MIGWLCAFGPAEGFFSQWWINWVHHAHPYWPGLDVICRWAGLI